MALTNSGRDHIAKMVAGEVATPFDNGNSYIAVGDGNTAFNAAQTDLVGTNKFRKAVDGTYPQRTNNVITYRATYSTAQANFAWEEWGVSNDASAGVLLNRKAEALGTKNSNQTWQFTVELTVANS